jgi:phospholipase/lecithinase/hemolysin
MENSMTANTSRRAFLALACAPAALLAACGSGTIESALKPTRLLSVGDGFSDLGQGGSRYTVNVTDGSVTVWTEQMASSYGLPLKAKAAGGTSFAQGGARINTDVAGGIPSIAAQITTLLAPGVGVGTIGINDVFLVSGGISDVVAEVTAHGISDQTTANVKAAGHALGAQVRRLVAAGAQYVVVAGLYNLGLSPWAANLSKATEITTLSNDFNIAFLTDVVDLGANVLYVDTAYYFNLVHGSPSSYGLNGDISSKTYVACATPDASTCTPSTIVSGVDYTKALFADDLYFTPVANRLFGTSAYNKLRTRW